MTESSCSSLSKGKLIQVNISTSHPDVVEVCLAHLVFPNHADALQALPKLHGRIYKSSLLSCVLKKRLDTLAKSPSHAGRLIVRNLSWDVRLLLPIAFGIDTEGDRLPNKTSVPPSSPSARFIPSTCPLSLRSFRQPRHAQGDSLSSGSWQERMLRRLWRTSMGR